MTWLLIGAALVVFGFAAVAGSGRLGEMPDPVDDLFAGYLPEELNPDTVGQVRFGTAARGYDRSAVDAALREAFSATEPPQFKVVRRGYRIEQVDAVFDRVDQMRNNGGELVHDEMRDSNGSDEATYR
ncbi:MAG: DivIVA domain-containing protein [Propionibacteriaceae bacterium]|nr:DivIVA domain-containing protein [Propionibacteriaceae bacterium]